MNKQTAPGIEPDNLRQALPASLVQPATLPDPQAGGSYTRDPVTGALTLVTPSTDSAATPNTTQE